MVDYYNYKMSGSEEEPEPHAQSGMTKAELRRVKISFQPAFSPSSHGSARGSVKRGYLFQTVISRNRFSFIHYPILIYRDFKILFVEKICINRGRICLLYNHV